MARGWGRAFRSRRTRTARLFLRGVRYSLLLFMSYEGLLGWYIRPGSINKEAFLEAVEMILVRPAAPPLPLCTLRAAPRCLRRCPSSSRSRADAA